jgi:predicted RNA-binding Zn-ribbon protein involved in translation (DUF1610 family)
MENEYICWGCLKVSKKSELKKDDISEYVCPKCGDDHISQTYNASNC